MDELKRLKAEQLKAIKSGNYPQLNEINKKIFALREQARKEREQAKQRERESRTDKKILTLLNAI